MAAQSQVTRSMSVGPDYHRHITLPWSSLTSPHTPNHRPELRFQSCCRDRGCHVPRSHIAYSLKDTVSMVRSRVDAILCLAMFVDLHLWNRRCVGGGVGSLILGNSVAILSSTHALVCERVFICSAAYSLGKYNELCPLIWEKSYIELSPLI